MEKVAKFKVGEIVGHKLSTGMKMFIAEVVCQECSGGVQISYLCRVASEMYGKFLIAPDKLYPFNEIELCEYSEKSKI